MTLIGKITTAFILLISLVFFALSVMVFTTHKRWQKVAMQVAAQLEDEKRNADHLRRDNQEVRNELAKERAWRRYLVQQQATKAAAETSRRETTARENASLTTQLSEVRDQRDLAVAEKTSLTNENNDLKKRLADSEELRSIQFVKIGELIDQNQKLSGEKLGLEKDYAESATLVTQQKLVLDTNGLTIHSINDGPPKLDGVITAVSPTQPLVQISLGKDDGLQAGHSLDVFRGNSYLGRIVIRDTKPNTAIGRVVKEIQKEPFRRGDRVATKLG